jgi:SAM-dependent methyltransferase
MPDVNQPDENNARFGPVDDYNEWAWFYDLYYRQATTDFDLYRELARQAGSEARVLELACGSGRLTLPLLQAGFNVTGLDLSQEMLNLFKEKLEGEPEELQKRARLILGDMRDLDAALGEEKFDLIILGFNSFQHLLNRSDQLACLRSARSHLAPGGRFVIAVVRPQVNPAEPANKRMEFFGSFPNPRRQSTVNLMVSTTEYPEIQESHQRYYFYEKLSEENTECTIVPMRLHYFYPEQLRELLEEAGFSIEKLYGSYQLDEFGEKSTKIVFLCRPFA